MSAASSVEQKSKIFKPIEGLGIGFLCWKNYQPFGEVLDQYREAGLLDLAAEKMIYFNGLDEAARAFARDQQIPFDGSSENRGILGGFKGLATAMASDYLLLLENDLPLIENADEVQRQLTQAVGALRRGEVQVFRMRHRHYPGQKFTTLDKYRKYHGDDPLASLRRRLRPGKAKRLIGTALYAEQEPEKKFPEIIPTAEGWWRVSAAHLPWTNQSIVVRRDFFLDVIIAYAEAHPSRRSVNGFPDIEKEWNSPKWRKSGWTIGVGQGLFTHERK